MKKLSRVFFFFFFKQQTTKLSLKTQDLEHTCFRGTKTERSEWGSDATILDILQCNVLCFTYVSPLILFHLYTTRLTKSLHPVSPFTLQSLYTPTCWVWVTVCVRGCASWGVKTVGEGSINYRQGCSAWLSALPQTHFLSTLKHTTAGLPNPSSLLMSRHSSIHTMAHQYQY